MAWVAWIGGGAGAIEALDGDRITFISSRAFAPGERPEGKLEVRSGTRPETVGHRVWVKVHGSRRREDGSFRVTGRLLNATKELRQILREALPARVGGKDSCP